LATATLLAQQGIAVSLFEAARHTGGRARGLNWKGHRLDNGQHILLGAYSQTLDLLHRAGVKSESAFLRLPLQFLQLPDFALRAYSKLPAPLHILAGLVRAKGLRQRERFAALRFMTLLRLRKFHLPQDMALNKFLSHHHQPEAVIRLLWEPICLAALNTPLPYASAQVFLNVLRDSFARTKSDSDLLLPRQDLSTLLAEPLSREIIRNHGEVISGAEVSAIRQNGHGFTLTSTDNERSFSHVVLAVQPFRAAALLSQLPQLAPIAQQCERFEYQPIYTVYVQYPDSVRLPFAMLGMNGGYSQWVLDRGSLDGQHGLLAVVISAQGPHQRIPQEALANAVKLELAAAFPKLPAPLWHKVIAEKRATFSCTPNLHRPSQRTPVTNFYLAGDYTEGDYPATIEGAVRSGVKCAQMIMESMR
jgi:squalene-associated FAD-dependent desaturase